MLVLALVSFASAATVPAVGVAASGEALLGAALPDHFQGSGIAVSAWGGFSLPYGLEGRLSLGYRRMGGTLVSTEWLWYVPVDLSVGVGLPVGKVTLLAYAGPSLVVWGTTPSDEAGIGASGGNWGVDADAGIRVPTSLAKPTLHDPDPVLQGIDVVVLAGFRWSEVHQAARAICDTCGFDFSAVHLDAGLAARF